MSDDIVERLRRQKYAMAFGMFKLCGDAADEIERLTAERDKWKLQAQYETDTAQAAIDEIERLRAAQSSISQISDGELWNELHRRAQHFLGDPTEGISFPISEG